MRGKAMRHRSILAKLEVVILKLVKGRNEPCWVFLEIWFKRARAVLSVNLILDSCCE
jgi:hypothetical protein